MLWTYLTVPMNSVHLVLTYMYMKAMLANWKQRTVRHLTKWGNEGNNNNNNNNNNNIPSPLASGKCACTYTAWNHPHCQHTPHTNVLTRCDEESKHTSWAPHTSNSTNQQLPPPSLPSTTQYQTIKRPEHCLQKHYATATVLAGKVQWKVLSVHVVMWCTCTVGRGTLTQISLSFVNIYSGNSKNKPWAYCSPGRLPSGLLINKFILQTGLLQCPCDVPWCLMFICY